MILEQAAEASRDATIPLGLVVDGAVGLVNRLGQTGTSKERVRDCSKPRVHYYCTAWLLFQYRNCNSHTMQLVLLPGLDTPTHPKKFTSSTTSKLYTCATPVRKKMELVWD